MYTNTCNYLRNVYINKNIYVRILNAHLQRKQFFSTKLPNQFTNETSNIQTKPKKPPVPKITLISSSDNSVSVTTLEEAQQLSKRRDLKLVKVVDLDTKTHRPIYKLMTGSEYHAEEIKHKEQKKKEKQTDSTIKGDKLLMLNSNISKHDLETNIKKIQKWIHKKYEVRIVISSNNSNMESAENVYKTIEDALKEESRFLQRRIKGSDLRFQILPPKSIDKSGQTL